MTEPTEKRKNTNKKILKYLGAPVAAIIVAIVVISVVSGGSGGDTPADAADEWDPTTDDMKIQAKVMCESFVKERLKSPSSAEFTSLMDADLDDLVSWEPKREVYDVTEQVDSKNGVGAMIRNNFDCVTKTTDQGENWTLVNLVGLN